MIDEMRAKLSDLSSQIERKKKIDTMLQCLRNQKQDLIRYEQRLKDDLCKEEADVEKLESMSATSILYSIIGKKDDKLDKEQQEAYAAKLKYDTAIRQLEDCNKRIDELCQERNSLSDCTVQYQQLFEKLQELLQEDTVYTEKLLALEKQRGENISQLKELGEAILAGNQVMQQIEHIENSLSSANGWGTWDLIGGGMISGFVKHSHLDNAQAGAEHLQLLLTRFHTELADVYIDNTQMGSVKVDGFLRFAIISLTD